MGEREEDFRIQISDPRSKIQDPRGEEGQRRALASAL
jgi:hypothetical protein